MMIVSTSKGHSLRRFQAPKRIVRPPKGRRTSAAIRAQLFSFHPLVSKFSKVLIKGGDWNVLSHGGGSDQTVDKASLRSLIAIQSVEVQDTRPAPPLEARLRTCIRRPLMLLTKRERMPAGRTAGLSGTSAALVTDDRSRATVDWAFVSIATGARTARPWISRRRVSAPDPRDATGSSVDFGDCRRCGRAITLSHQSPEARERRQGQPFICCGGPDSLQN
jgi:hypothetical protein